METYKVEPATKRGRKPGSKAATQKKKPPQRGMGVAQLERLRLQETWRLDCLGTQNQYYQQPISHLGLPEPISSVPMMHGSGNIGFPVVSGSGLLGLEQGQVMQKEFGGVGGGSGQVLMNGYNRVGGGHEPNLSLVALVGTSKELSSMPKMQQQQQQHQPLAVLPPERCDFCVKKQRYHGEDMGFHAVKDKYAEVSPIKGYDTPGLMNHESYLHFNGGIGSFGAKAVRSAFYAGPNYHLTNEGAQSVVLHRNGNLMGRNFPKEYEFFPGKGGRSTSSKELEFPAETSVAVCGEASCFTTTACRTNVPSNSIDLSLKLSL